MNPITRFTHLMFALWLTAVSISCEREADQGPAPDAVASIANTRAEMVSHIARKLIVPAYEDLDQAVQRLDESLAGFQASPTTEGLLEAQEALKAAWLTWQASAMYMLGPAQNQTLRQALATYPVDIGKVEQNISQGTFNLETLDNRAAAGFPALDYLLNGLAEEPETILTYYTSAPNADQRSAYLVELSRVIGDKVATVLSEWAGPGNNFLATFTGESMMGTDVGSSLGLLVNAMDLHFQRFVRDGKVAIPAGIRSAGVPRPKAVEAYFGGYSVDLLAASLNAYKALFLGIDTEGQDGIGLSDYLVKLGATSLAEDMAAQFDRSLAAANTLQDPLDQQIEADPESLNPVFLELQTLVVLFKSDMASTMGISITNQDNDGD